MKHQDLARTVSARKSRDAVVPGRGRFYMSCAFEGSLAWGGRSGVGGRCLGVREIERFRSWKHGRFDEGKVRIKKKDGEM